MSGLQNVTMENTDENTERSNTFSSSRYLFIYLTTNLQNNTTEIIELLMHNAD